MSKKNIVIVMLLLSAYISKAQLLQENFSYTTGDSIVSTLIPKGWLQIGTTTTNRVLSVANGLTFSGYKASGVGNAAGLVTSGQDIYKDASSLVNSSSIYSACLINVSAVQATGDYFMAFLPSTSTTTYTGRLHLKLSSAGFFRVGISKANAGANETVIYSTDTFSLNTTYAVVTKYMFNTGSSTDDSVKVFVFANSFPSIEPIAFTTQTQVINPVTDAVNLSRVGLRQGSASAAPTLTVDGILLATTWSDLVDIGVQPPAPITSLNTTATSQTSLALTWTKAAGYVDSNMSTLVFLKEATAITQGTPSALASTYIADTNFLGTGTLYQNDSLAKCVYNADGNTVAIGNLKPNIFYHVLVYTIRNTDTSYSLGVLANLKTLPVPSPSSISTPLFSATTKTTTTLSWIKPVEYIDSTMTTLVFLKQTNAVTIDIPTFNPSTYIANANYTLATSAYQNDTAAKCVLNNDNNTLNITGLTPGIHYHALIYVVRNSDSSYSNSTTASIQTLAVPATVTALSFTANGQTTATINWTKASGYSDSNMSTLVFVKEANAITQGTPSLLANNYTADTNIIGNGSPYQHDALAKCVYNGDENNVSISNLISNTVYHILVYTVRNSDTAYSAGVIENEKTFGANPPPAAIQTIANSTIGLTSSTILWTLDSNYMDSSMTVVIYMKAGTNITVGNPTVSSQSITGNMVLGLGTKYENDSFASSVYKGDGLQTDVYGLTANTDYTVLAFVIKDADTVYSSELVFTFKTIDNPSPITNLQISNKSQTGFTINWTKPLNFDTTNSKIVVFVKKASATIIGIPTFETLVYTANTTFGLGTTYQNDTASFCVYNGMQTSVAIDGLTAATTYYVSAFIIRNTDIGYSTVSNAVDSTSLGNPVSPTAVSFTGTSQTTARINWTKPTEYNNATYTTLVFVKEGNINSGTPNKNSPAYTANTALGLGSRFDADSTAFCVFKGDTTFVNITALKSNTQYQVFAFVMRDIDSLSSLAAIGNGNSQGPPPLYTIGQINKTNTITGVPDSLTVKATIRGVVYGFNQRNTGIQVLLRDATGGITLFNSSKNFGYSPVSEGDEIEASGTIATFRGLTQLTLDTLIKTGTNGMIKIPNKTTVLNETTENDLIRIDSVRFASLPAGSIWPTNSTNFSVVTPLNDTLVIRVLSNSTLAGKNFPTTPTFSVIGMGAQFSTSTTAPFLFNGYQLFPRTQNDIIEVAATPIDSLLPFDLLSPNNGDTIDITNTNQEDSITINWSTCINSNGVDIATYTFLLDTLGGDFGIPLVTVPTDESTFIKLTKGDILAEILLPFGVNSGQIFAGNWLVKASSNMLVRNSTQQFIIYISNNTSVGLAETNLLKNIHIAPNPSRDFTVVSGLSKNDNLTLLDISGKVMYTATANVSEITIPLQNLIGGMYFIKIQNGNTSAVKKLVVQ